MALFDRFKQTDESEMSFIDHLEVLRCTIVRSLRSIFTEQDITTECVDISQAIDKVLEIVKPELKSKNIQIILSADGDLLARVRETEIQQVLLNLINNAIQAVAAKENHSGRIQIEANQKEDKVQIVISDNGVGVPQEQQSRLFELLNTTKQTGMGLGLWLCKHIVTRHSGSIHHEDIVGGGARFVIKLPQAY
jgi:C4-dicarboxylate-specific signal transduction histidine kinase